MFCKHYGNLAEWLRRSPAKAVGHARAGSNPAVVEDYYVCRMPDWLNWIERKTSNLEVEGSSPLSGKEQPKWVRNNLFVFAQLSLSKLNYLRKRKQQKSLLDL